MSVRRAALSVNATVGVAIATLLVVGGILSGSSILECSRDPSGFGACLRDKAAESGLIAPGTERVERPEIVADVPSEEPSGLPAPAGWMEANANEFEPLASASVDLNGTPADVVAAELAPISEAPVAVAVVPPVELATGVPAPRGETAVVALDGAKLDVVAEGALSREAIPPAAVALVGPQGDVTAMSPVLEMPADAATELTQPGELIAEGADTEQPITELTPEPTPVELQADVSAAPIEAPPPVAIEFNPQYPNVLVLPPPVGGDNSSFRSLQLN